MCASEAQIQANRSNSAKSSGPKSTRGKLASRANSYKHGLTGEGAVLPELEAAEVDRRAEALFDEYRPSGELGAALVHQVALMSVRMEMCAKHLNRASTARVRQALAEYDVPEGISEAEFERLRQEETDRVLFDTSKEGILARKYAAAAERSFFRALNELRQLAKEAKAVSEIKTDEIMASILSGGSSDDVFENMFADAMKKNRRKPVDRDELDDLADLTGGVDVPISIGKRPPIGK
jgi:hypothetical protein